MIKYKLLPYACAIFLCGCAANAPQPSVQVQPQNLIFNDVKPGDPQQVVNPNEPPVITMDKLSAMASQENKNLPIQIDKDTIMNSILPTSDGNLAYYMQLNHLNIKSLTPDQVNKIRILVSYTIQKRFCGSSAAKNLFSGGVKNVSYVYTDNEGQEFLNKKIHLSGCFVPPQYVQLSTATPEQMDKLTVQLENYFVARNKLDNKTQFNVTHMDREVIITTKIQQGSNTDQVINNDIDKAKPIYINEVCENDNLIKILQHDVTLHFIINQDTVPLADFKVGLHDCETML